MSVTYSLWPEWLRLELLFLLPFLIFILYVIWNISSFNSGWSKIIPARFRDWLLSNDLKTQQSILIKSILSLIFILSFIALLGPSWQKQNLPAISKISPLVIMLDASQEMNATDLSPNRMEVAKHKIDDLITERGRDKTALVVYAGTAHTVVPLTDDDKIINNMLSGIKTTIMPQQGQNPSAGVSQAIELLKRQPQYEDVNDNNQIAGTILLMASNVTMNQKNNIIAMLDQYPKIKLDIIGVGTDKPTAISSSQGYATDGNGNLLTTILTEKPMIELANAVGGQYHRITLNNKDLQSLALINATSKHQQQSADGDKKELNVPEDQGYWFLLPVLILFALGSRKGWLYCLPFLFVLSSSPKAYAAGMDDLLLNQNQQAQKALNKGDYQQASNEFTDQDWKAYANYMAGNYSDAEAYYKNSTDVDGIYNYGNSLAQQGKYQAALDTWNDVLKLSPDYQSAIKNIEIVKELLKKQQNDQTNSSDEDQQSDNSQDDDSKQNQSESSQDEQKENAENKQKQQTKTSEESDNKQDQSANEQQMNQKSDSEDKDTQQQKMIDENNKQDEYSDEEKRQDQFRQEDKKNEDEKKKENELAQIEEKNDENQDQNKDENEKHQLSEAEIRQQEKEQQFERKMQQIPETPAALSQLLKNKFHRDMRSQ